MAYTSLRYRGDSLRCRSKHAISRICRYSGRQNARRYRNLHEFVERYAVHTRTFRRSKTNIKESILSAKPGFRSASTVYEAWKRMGYTQDPAIDKMKKIETLKFEDIIDFYNENIKGKPVVIAIVGNPKDFDTKALEKIRKSSQSFRIETILR